MRIWPFRRRPIACGDIISFLVSVEPPPHRKPRVRIRPDGWVRHLGGPFPFHPLTFVEVIFAGGDRREGQAAEAARSTPAEWWQQSADHPRWNVRLYRIVAPPSYPEVQP